MTYSEKLFEEFCSANRTKFRRISAAASRTPDYELDIGGTLIVCEIKQIDLNKEDRRIMQELAERKISANYVRSRARDKMKDVSAQLKTAAKSGAATMLVLYNNTPVHDYTEHSEIVRAMFGRKTWRVVWVDDQPRLSKPFFGGARSMTPEHNTSVSVVAVLERRENSPLRLRTYHNPYAVVPLDPGVLRDLPVDLEVGPETEEVEC